MFYENQLSKYRILILKQFKKRFYKKTFFKQSELVSFLVCSSKLCVFHHANSLKQLPRQQLWEKQQHPNLSYFYEL